MIHVLGIDPGLDGALALLRKTQDGDQLVSVWDMPTATRNGKRHVDIGKLWDLLRLDIYSIGRTVYLMDPPAFYTVIEQVRAMPRHMGGKEIKMGAQSSFNFGEGFGIIRALAHAVQAGSVKTVEARVWKLRAGLIGEPKEAALDKVLSLYPGEGVFTPKRGKLRKANAIGRADAALVATYGQSYAPNVEDLF